MILWVVLFVLIVAISFVLAARSMRDFTEIPNKDEEYSLFLIRQPQKLNTKLLESIHNDLAHSKSIISFERLFKGNKSALVVFGPKKLLVTQQNLLDLLELEDYTNINVENISAWEVGIKNNRSLDFPRDAQKILTNLPQLLENDQFWWQLVISSEFRVQIRTVVVSDNQTRRDSLTQALQALAPETIIKLPKAFSNTQLLDFYKIRSFTKDSKNPTLISEEILQMLSI